MKEEYSYRKLKVYEKATNLVIHVYALIKKFPREEQYALCDQLRRAVVSVPSNIAEGMGRFSNKERVHFIQIAYGSLMETNCQMEIAYKLGYITEEELKELDDECDEIGRMLSGLRGALLHSGKTSVKSVETRENREENTLDSRLITIDSKLLTLDQKLSTLDQKLSTK